MRRREPGASGGLGSYALAAACVLAAVAAVAVPSHPGPERVLHWACAAILLLLGINRVMITHWRRRRAGRDPRWGGRDD